MPAPFVHSTIARWQEATDPQFPKGGSQRACHTEGAHPTASGRRKEVVLFRQSYPALTNGGVDDKWSGWKVDKLESAHACGGRHVHVVNTHSHALRYTALHCSCSVLCSLCTVSVQRSVAQIACVLPFSDRGDRVHVR